MNLAPSFNIFMLFIIDGLDEFDDRVEIRKNSAPDVQDLLHLLRVIQASPLAKLCVASRPLNEFEIHLGKDSDFCIPVHDLTLRDITRYTKDTLSKHPSFSQLVSQDPGYATLITNITSAAEGVFLWVYLACNSLLNGLTNADRVSDLQGRLMRLPRELDEMYMHILSTIELEYRRNTARSLLLCTTSSYQTLLTHYYLDDESRRHISDIPSLEQFMNAEDLLLFAATVRRRFNARSKGLLNSESSSNYGARDESLGVQNEMSKFIDETVGLAHRSLAELLDRDEMRHRIINEACMEVEMPELLAQASIATFKAQASIAWTLTPTQDSGICVGETHRNSFERKLTRSLGHLVTILERTEEEHIKEHWSKLDKILEFSLPHKVKLKATIVSCVPNEPHPDIFAVAVAYSAPKYVSLMLRQTPLLIATKPKAWPPLLMALIWDFLSPAPHHRRLKVIEILLEHGADPNEPFEGTTPWMCYLENALHHSLSDHQEPTFVLTRDEILHLLVQYGANIHATWNWLGYCSDERTGKVDRVIPSFADYIYRKGRPQVATVSLQLSAAAVLYHILTKVGSPDSWKDPAPEWLPSVPEQEQVAVVLKGQGICNSEAVRRGGAIEVS